MKGMVVEQVVVVERERAEEGDKEKKKRRRSNRRSKNNAAVSGAGFSSVDGIYGQASNQIGHGTTSDSATLSLESSSPNKDERAICASNEQGLVRASNVAFSSLPTMHINGDGELGSMQDPRSSPSDMGGNFIAVSCKSCPEPLSYEETNISSPNKEFLPCHNHKDEGYTDTIQRKYFNAHWSEKAVNDAIKKGEVFKASFRVNAYNRLEAYCTLDGVPNDVLISGVAAQNRAIEGDIVAVKLDPVASWTRLKGSAGHVNNSTWMDESSIPSKVIEVVGNNCKGKDKLDDDCEYSVCENGLLPSEIMHHYEVNFFTEGVCSDVGIGPSCSNNGSSGRQYSASDPSNLGYASEKGEAARALGKVCDVISSFPSIRPTGRVLAIIERSPRRDTVIGFLAVKQWLSYREGYRKEIDGKSSKNIENSMLFSSREYIQLTPTDAKFPKMVVAVRSLSDCIKERLEKSDTTVGMEIVAAKIVDWRDDNFLPQVHVMHVFGRGGEIEPQIAAILYENAVCSAKFSPQSLACLPDVPWKVPVEELKRRKDLRNLCTFTIDPSTATDLDDALSFERVSDDILRVGVHIADVSYFVQSGTSLDMEAQSRSTSVYLLQHKIPMLPSQLSENFCSLNPGVDRLAFSMIWDINCSGDIIDNWIGHSVIRSCCKMSYQHAQDIIDGYLDTQSSNTSTNGYPELHGHFVLHDVINSVRSLHEVSKRLKENRFKHGALCLESSKLVFLFDDSGMPYDTMLCEQKDSNFLVEEFMLLANRTAAEVVSRFFPDCALLRRHPVPNLRKLKEFEAFCRKHGFELDTSSSGKMHLSLLKIREKLKNDPLMFDILVTYASRPMQLATYFCTGDLRDRENDWAHYSLAVPLYTHYTSPMRRYPDIVVHRTLAAALEAEESYLQQSKYKDDGTVASENPNEIKFSGFYFEKYLSESKGGKEALSAAALKHGVPGTAALAGVAAYCNKRMLASRHAEEASDKLYLWALLKKKESLFSEARVLGLGPKFMSVYIHSFAMERRIFYDEVEGLVIEWLETTSTLVLNFCTNKRFRKRGSTGKSRTLEGVALVVNPCDLNTYQSVPKDSKVESTQEAGPSIVTPPENNLNPHIAEKSKVDPAVFPLTLRLLSSVPVVLHAIGGDDCPLDIGVRLFLSSYFR